MLRNKAKEIIKEVASHKQYEELLNEVISGNIHKQLRETLYKIFPVKTCDIRALKVEEGRSAPREKK